ncbi:MAG TPA: hypothetical protein VG672_17665, partial [Bryobacteraceae bacterium]|nr:hypothetical protein [Bryobacteraceae bacterium]
MRTQRLAVLTLVGGMGLLSAATPLRVATFRADVTPPLGSALCQGFVKPAAYIHDALTARGIVLLSSQAPIVLCAVDWVGIGDRSHDAWKEALARAAGTTPDRVAVHTLHLHDAPGADLRADDLVAGYGLPNSLDDQAFVRTAMERTAAAVHASLSSAQVFTHAGFGAGRVERVASNRRVMGPDGKVKAVRWSATLDPAVRAEPEGTIDPYVRLLSLWNGQKPLVSITYYATHPQSYYGKGEVSADFPGLARALREGVLPEVAHIHFNGASGNVTAGKYNDGAHENRPHLAG